jgi:hypothetical protein
VSAECSTKRYIAGEEDHESKTGISLIDNTERWGSPEPDEGCHVR